MRMPVLIWGAGAIGGTIGAYLARAGHAVTLVDTMAEHVDRINADGGLHIEGPIEQFRVRVPAVTPGHVEGRHPLVLLAVKAQHTTQAAQMLLPHLAEDGAVVSCQNGLNELTLTEIIGRPRTIGAFVNFGADWLEPGRITFANRGAAVLGELDGATTARITALHRLLLEFEPGAIVTDNIFGYLWGKLAWGAISIASAVTDETMAVFTAHPQLRPFVIGVYKEVLAVAAAEGVRVMGFHGFDPAAFARNDEPAMTESLARIVAFRKASAKPRSGIWRDLAVRHRPTEVAAQLAPVQVAAHRHGLATPIIDHVVHAIAELEAGRRTRGMELALELRATALAARR
jgi:2-dehydropantoate 2-reductase